MKTISSSLPPFALLAALAAGCGSPPPPADPVAPPPTSASAPVATSAPPTPPPAPPIDPSLPKSAAFVLSSDLSKLVAAMSVPEIAALVKQAGVDPSAISLASIDVKRPLAIAIFSISDETRDALAPLKADPKSFGDHAFEALLSAYRAAKPSMKVRALVPSTDVDKTMLALRMLMKMADLSEKSPGIYETRHMLVRASKTADTIVLDLAIGDDKTFDALDAEVKKAPADPPALDGRLARIRYSPQKMGDIQLMNTVLRTTGALSGESVDPSQRERIATMALSDGFGVMSAGTIFDEVDISARNDGGKVTLDIKSSDSSTAKFPPADAWKPSPTVALEQGTGAITISNALARAWILPGDSPTDAFTKSSFVESVREDPRFNGWIALPFLAPVMARGFAYQSSFAPGAYEKFDRAGFLFDKDGEAIFFALLPKEVQGEAAQCALTGEAKCAKEAHLKVDEKADLKAPRKSRLIHVKGSKQLAIILGDDKKRLDDAHLVIGSGPAVEFSFPKHSSAFDIPGLAAGGHVDGTFGVENHSSVIHFEGK